jgi:cysteinyl-tRNA synthetase
VVRVESLIKERTEARKMKNFARADEIRNELNATKVELNDRPDGTTEWFVRS